MKKGNFIIKLKKLPKIALAMALVVGMSFATSYASSLEDAQQDKEDAEQNKNEAQNVLDELEKEQNELISEVAALDAQVTEIQSQITVKQEEADALEAEIESTRVDLADAQAAQDDQYAHMLSRIQYLYENGDVEYIDTLLSSASFTDMLNKSEYVEQISSYDQQQLNDLIAIKESVAEYETTLEKDLADIETVQADLEAQQTELQATMDAKNEKIDQYDTDIASQEALVNKYAEAEQAAEALIAQYEAASIAAQQSSGYTVYDSASYSGKFMWPAVSGSRISSGYGPRTAPTKGASTYHKGVDIPCPSGSDIVAAESGTVVISQYSNSAGNYIMIDHGGGVCTVYMHNSQLLVSVGQTVTKGQVIAKAGSTGYSTGPHCHFAVKINGNYVDPTSYLY
jgi:murein DD-endopeptidase MepM/ murein hydrolase activator NlpD